VDARQIDALAEYLSVVLPDDYRAALADFGILSFRGATIYGVGVRGVPSDAAPSAGWITMLHRREGLIADGMVEIMSAGDGPVFVLDCAKTAGTGEAPVVMIPLEGHRSPDVETVAPSFGAFLLGQVRASLDRRTA
jgi:hypothetical protein